MAQRSGTWTTVAEFCDELGISRSTFDDWRAKGRTPRAVLHNALDYVVERNLLTRNALPDLKWTPPKSVRAIDKRTVVNHGQATEQLNAMRGQVPSGPRLVPFFAVMHYAEARPGEAVNVRRGDVALPALVENSETGEWEETENGWGELLLSESAPETGARWSSGATGGSSSTAARAIRARCGAHRPW